mmetsp:Transcript_6693/g.21395  ORF Transcript_6693/g.21395 Transcript_6693/m.21395 type:complete len:221 (+) Transcript_6693:168-830(+)
MQSPPLQRRSRLLGMQPRLSLPRPLRQRPSVAALGRPRGPWRRSSRRKGPPGGSGLLACSTNGSPTGASTRRATRITTSGTASTKTTDSAGRIASRLHSVATQISTRVTRRWTYPIRSAASFASSLQRACATRVTGAATTIASPRSTTATTATSRTTSSVASASPPTAMTSVAWAASTASAARCTWVIFALTGTTAMRSRCWRWQSEMRLACGATWRMSA